MVQLVLSDRGPPNPLFEKSFTVQHSMCRCLLTPTIKTNLVKDEKIMTTKKTLPAGITVGAKAPEQKEGGSFWGLKQKETFQILADLDECISVQQYGIWNKGYSPAPVWVDIGDDDPGVELGLNSSYRAFLPVLVDTDEGKAVKIWAFPITVHRTLEEIAEMIDGLKGAIVKGNRTGTGRSTNYTIVASGKKEAIKVDVPSVDDVIEALNVRNRQQIINWIEERTGESYSEVYEKVTGQAATDDDLESEEL